MKSWYQSKTIWFGILYTATQFAGIIGLGEYSPPAGLVELVEQLVGLAMIGLRFVTREAVTA